MGFVRTALLAGAAAVWAAGAWADTLTLAKQNGTGASANPASVVVDYESPVRSGSAWAGGFDMKDTGSHQTFGQRFIAWCLDLSKTLQSGKYEVKSDTNTTVFNNRASTGDPTNQLSVNRKVNINNLFNAVYDGLDLTDATKSAAFQVALWELAYEVENNIGSDLFGSTGSGNFKLTNAVAVQTQANTYVDLALDYMGAKRFNVFYLQATDPVNNQNLVTATVVPLPAAGFLLIGGLGALAMVRRRRETAAA